MPKIIKRIIGIFAAFLGLAIILSGTAVFLLMHFNSPPEFSYEKAELQDGVTVEKNEISGTVVHFEVKKDEIAQSVGQRLAGASLIRNEYFWLLLCRYSGEHIKAGRYRITLPATLIEIHSLLVSGRQALQRVSIPEGFTLKKTAKILEELDICPAEAFMAAAFDPEIVSRYRIPGLSMEGYLYPDTYLFQNNYPAEKVIEAMADNFFKNIENIDENLRKLNPDDLNNLVILASIIEREYMLPEEAPEMAGVFKNRLNIGMALQSCATVVYIITEILDRPHPEILSNRDIEIQNPYNTYIRTGLPPGPISSPGAVSLKAAYFPAANNYLYFRLVDPNSGKHYFSKNLDEHIKAGKLYVKGR